MSRLTGEEIFEKYLTYLEQEIGDDEISEIPSDDALNNHFENYLQEHLSHQFDGIFLDNIREAAANAYRRDKVNILYANRINQD
jgi:hypothetical protein